MRKLRAAFIVILVLGLPTCMYCRQESLHKARYSNGVTFYGRADGWFDSHFNRATYHDYGGFPPLTLHLDDRAVPISALSKSIVTELMCYYPEGAIQGQNDMRVSYRFHEDRLNALSIEKYSTPDRPFRPGAPLINTLAISWEDGPPITLPINLSELRKAFGSPKSIDWSSGQ